MASYPYAPRLSPAAGNGLGGLPRKKEGGGVGLPAVIYFDSGSGEFKVPAGYSQIRIAAVGPGGSSSNLSGQTGGGGGGGLAATNIVKVSEGDVVSYSVGVVADIASAVQGGSTTVKFKAYSLVAGAGGQVTVTGNPYTGGLGGTASGGDVNFAGGQGGSGASSGYGGGGGAAGLGSNGGGGANFNALTPIAPSITSGDQAGGGGGGYGNSAAGGGGGGSGARGSYGADSSSNLLPPAQNITSTRSVIGLPPVNTQSSGRVGPNGGQGGGGASGAGYSGGTGCVRIELFP